MPPCPAGWFLPCLPPGLRPRRRLVFQPRLGHKVGRCPEQFLLMPHPLGRVKPLERVQGSGLWENWLADDRLQGSGRREEPFNRCSCAQKTAAGCTTAYPAGAGAEAKGKRRQEDKSEEDEMGVLPLKGKEEADRLPPRVRSIAAFAHGTPGRGNHRRGRQGGD